MPRLSQVETLWGRFGSMINTALIVGAFLAAVFQGGAYKQEVDTSIAKNASDLAQFEASEAAQWKAHADLHKERLAEVTGQAGANEERFRAIERDIQKIDRLDYRLTSTETTTNNTAASIKDLQALISQQAGDLKVVREILQRLEASEQRRTR